MQPPIQSAASGQSFLGIGFSKIAFSTANPNLVVAATAGDNGLCLARKRAGGKHRPVPRPARGWEFDGARTLLLANAGVTWNRATLTDGAVPASATAVIYNPRQGTNGTFYAFIRRHGLYSSTDGQNFTPSGDATERGSCIRELPGEFERNDLPDLSWRVRGGAGTQRDVCVGRRRAARHRWKSQCPPTRASGRSTERRSELDADSGQRHHELR